ncbi:hypothetical protein BPNPMPFG_000900 [Mesorhizobium sp. AR07]|uniref:hypothetical protein n=1 Tax=Mesorhizobium sp. AR07 TaxID=2865838 RepID=UPI00215EF0F4|nr:hypothetical protein [Mesorhizobium sp. AR07]UVK45370.1 hypothetical protein BPNPMPFG_000900 [Mesorhizobium sp. AR07]
MKFVPTAEYTYWWPIKVKMPHPDKSGLWITETFEMQFASVTSDEAGRIRKELAELRGDERTSHEHDQLLNACRDWRGVVDDDKKAIAFDRELLVTMLKAGPWYRQGIYECYGNSLISDAARTGN